MATAQNHLIFRKYTFRQFDKNINNRPMGEIAHLRNQFKLKNTFTRSYDYNILLIWREKNPSSPFLSPLYPWMLCVKFGWNWPSDSWEDFFNFIIVFSLFRNYLPLEEDVALHLNKLESPSPKEVLSQVWLKLAKWFWRRWKCEKFTDGQMDDRWSEKLTSDFSSGELKIMYKDKNTPVKDYKNIQRTPFKWSPWDNFTSCPVLSSDTRQSFYGIFLSSLCTAPYPLHWCPDLGVRSVVSTSALSLEDICDKGPFLLLTR